MFFAPLFRFILSLQVSLEEAFSDLIVNVNGNGAPHVSIVDVLSIVGPKRFLTLYSIVMGFPEDSRRAAFVRYADRMVEDVLKAQRDAIYVAEYDARKADRYVVKVNAPATRIQSTLGPDKVRMLVAAFSR